VVTKLNTQLLEDGLIERQFKYDPSTTSGLTFGITGGYYNVANTVNELFATTVTLTDDDVNYIYIDTTVPEIVAEIVIQEDNHILCYVVTTSSGVITNIEDARIRNIGFTVS